MPAAAAQSRDRVLLLSGKLGLLGICDPAACRAGGSTTRAAGRGFEAPRGAGQSTVSPSAAPCSDEPTLVLQIVPQVCLAAESL